jgi:hypothetical protein
MSSEPAPEVVFVGLISRAASTTPEVFQVGLIETVGSVWEPLSELETVRGTAVLPRIVATFRRN